MKPVLTIVIPVYNVAKYVEKCIRSVYNQSLSMDSYEVIVVNDGTKDDSLQICENLQAEIPSLKIISQENRGLSGARNTGLRNAIGDYVWFVDSDDWIKEDCLVSIVDTLIKHKADISWLGHTVVLNDKLDRLFVPKKTQNTITGEEFFISHLNNLFFIWKFIYKREFLQDNELSFYEGILYEDLEFTPRALLKARTCITIPHAYYYYLVREGSIVTNVKDKNIEDRFFVLDRLNELKKTTGISDEFSSKIDLVISHSYIDTIKMSARAKLKLPHSAYQVLKIIKFNKTKIVANKIDFFIINLNLNLYHFIYQKSYSLYQKLSKN